MSWRTRLFYWSAYYWDLLPFEWWITFVEWIRYEYLWVSEDHEDDYL